MGVLLISLVIFFIFMPLTQKEKIRSMVKLVSVVISSLLMSLTILYIEWEQNSFLLLALFTLFQEVMHGIILPILFINNLPNLKNFILDKINYQIIETNTAIQSLSKTIFDTVSSYVPKRDNQIDVIA